MDEKGTYHWAPETPPQPKKKKQGGEEKHSGTNENGRVGQRPYARGRAYDEKHYE